VSDGQLTAEGVTALLGTAEFRLAGDRHRPVEGVAPLDRAGPGQLAFCSAAGDAARARIRESGAGTVICRDDAWLEEEAAAGKTLIAVSEPRLAFVRALTAIAPEERPQGIHPTAFVEPGAEVAADAYVGPFTYVGEATIGAGTVLYGHSHIHSGVTIGRNVTIEVGTTIGIHGFGMHRNEQGELEPFPQIGTVVIEDGVDIGANSNVQRGTLGATIIREGTKIDSYVHVGHNVEIGRHVAIAAHAMLGGSARIGDYAWIGPSACIRDGEISIGERALVGLGAVVVKDVPAGATVMGVPARDAAEFKALQERLRTLGRGAPGR
jgi:UDP-3-O-[3-hydroxymyristoyl] glucosamine N-acyltransferase